MVALERVEVRLRGRPVVDEARGWFQSFPLLALHSPQMLSIVGVVSGREVESRNLLHRVAPAWVLVEAGVREVVLVVALLETARDRSRTVQGILLASPERQVLKGPTEALLVIDRLVRSCIRGLGTFPSPRWRLSVHRPLAPKAVQDSLQHG